MRATGWFLMTFLAASVGLYAGAAILTPVARPPFLSDLFLNAPAAITLHLAGGMVAIIVGAFQVNSRLRSKFLNVHRWFGRIYLVAVLVGGVAALALAWNSFGGPVTHFGFGMLAVCWLGSTAAAYYYIRQRDIQTHRAWMYRSYALTLAAVTLRIYLPLSQIAGVEFAAAYPAISWMCWVPNLLIVEWFILTRKSPAATGA